MDFRPKNSYRNGLQNTCIETSKKSMNDKCICDIIGPCKCKPDEKNNFISKLSLITARVFRESRQIVNEKKPSCSCNIRYKKAVKPKLNKINDNGISKSDIKNECHLINIEKEVSEIKPDKETYSNIGKKGEITNDSEKGGEINFKSNDPNYDINNVSHNSIEVDDFLLNNVDQSTKTELQNFIEMLIDDCCMIKSINEISCCKLESKQIKNSPSNNSHEINDQNISSNKSFENKNGQSILGDPNKNVPEDKIIQTLTKPPQNGNEYATKMNQTITNPTQNKDDYITKEVQTTKSIDLKSDNTAKCICCNPKCINELHKNQYFKINNLDKSDLILNEQKVYESNSKEFNNKNLQSKLKITVQRKPKNIYSMQGRNYAINGFNDRSTSVPKFMVNKSVQRANQSKTEQTIPFMLSQGMQSTFRCCEASKTVREISNKIDFLENALGVYISSKSTSTNKRNDPPEKNENNYPQKSISIMPHLNHSSPAKESYYFSNAVQHENESKPNIPKKKLCRSKPPAYETCDSSSKETCCYCKKRKKKRKTKSKPLGNPNDSSFTNVHPQNGKQVPMITNIPSNQELCYRQVPLSNNVLPKETNNNILIPPESNDVKVIIKELNSQKTNIEDLKNLVENCMDILNKTISEKDQDGPDVSETKSKRKASTTSFFRRFSSTFPKKENNQIKENDNYSPYQNTSPYLKPGATDIKNRNKSSSIVFLKRQSSNMSDDEETNDKNNKDEKTKKIPEVNKNRKNSQDIIDKNNKIKSSNLELKEIDRKDQAEKEKTTNKKKSKKKKKTLCFCCPSCCD